MAAAAEREGSRLDRVIGFVDGTFPFPSRYEQLFYNRRVAAALAASRRVTVLACSHYHSHGFKFQGIQFVCGLFALDGPYRGSQHDLTLYELSHVQDIMREHFGTFVHCTGRVVMLIGCYVAVHGVGTWYYLYADGAYRCSHWLQAPHLKPRSSPLPEALTEYNKDMSSTRIVEWLFKDLTANCPHFDQKRLQKLLLNEPCMEYTVAAVLRQMIQCRKKTSECSIYFKCYPPQLSTLMGVLGTPTLVLP